MCTWQAYELAIITPVCVTALHVAAMRATILAKSEFKDDTIELLPYFSPSAFTGYGDDTRVGLSF